MIDGLYVSTWGAIASQMRHDVVANNLANVNTTGFRADWATMTSYSNAEELRREAARPDRQVLWAVGGGGMVAETRTAHVPGPVHATGRSLDLALNGSNAFFALQRNGEVRYTRAGDFKVGSQGELVTSGGDWQVQCDSQVNLGGDNVTIGRDGTISRVVAGVKEDLGKLRLVTFDNPERLVKVGQTQFIAPADANLRPAGEDITVEQGCLEGSGTNAAESMVQMIEAFRSYETNMQFMRVHDQLLGRAVSDIARLG